MSRVTPITFRIRPATNEDAASVRALVFSTLAEFKLPVLPETTDADLNDLEASYFQTGGTFDVVEGPDVGIVGCVGLRLLGNGQAELLKLYLWPEVRGMGLGDLLLKRMVQKARELGCEEIRLETNSVLRDAARLYKRQGFTPVEPEHPSARCDETYCLRLRESPVSGKPRVQELPIMWTKWTVRRSKEAGVPRQFGVGTGLLITTMFAVLFAVLRGLNIPPREFAYVALFFLGVGAGQAVLFHGRRPRWASIVMGIVMTFALGVFDAIFDGDRSMLVEASFSPFCPGAIFGYLAGLLIAGVFLVRDRLEDAYRRRFPPKDEEP